MAGSARATPHAAPGTRLQRRQACRARSGWQHGHRQLPAIVRHARTLDGWMRPVQTNAGLMAVVGLPRRVLETLCRTRGAALAIINGDDHAVLGGPRDALQILGDAAQWQGPRITLLPVSVPAHTPWLRAAADSLKTANITAPTLRVLAGVDARAVTTQALVIDTLSAQIAQTASGRAAAAVLCRWHRLCIRFIGGGARCHHSAGDAVPDAWPARRGRGNLRAVRVVHHRRCQPVLDQWRAGAGLGCERGARRAVPLLPGLQRAGGALFGLLLAWLLLVVPGWL